MCTLPHENLQLKFDVHRASGDWHRPGTSSHREETRDKVWRINSLVPHTVVWLCVKRANTSLPTRGDPNVTSRTSLRLALNLRSSAGIVAMAAPIECPIAYSGAPGWRAAMARTAAVMFGSSELLL